MLLLDIINETILGTNNKDKINLLSRPMASIHNKDNEREIFFPNYPDADFDKFCEGMLSLHQKYIKTKRKE